MITLKKLSTFSLIEVQCPEKVSRKEENLIDLDYVINEIQNKFYLIFKPIECEHGLTLIRCVFICQHVNICIGLTLSACS